MICLEILLYIPFQVYHMVNRKPLHNDVLGMFYCFPQYQALNFRKIYKNLFMVSARFCEIYFIL